MPKPSKSTRFWETVCAGLPIWMIMFGMCIVFLVFMLLSLYVAEPEAGAFEMIVINIVLICILLAVLGTTIRKCRGGDF